MATGMKIVVMGDIGKQALYHVGDEAMTEAAIDLLRVRDPQAQITLVATDPEVAEERYGLPSIARFGYLFSWSRGRLEKTLTQATDAPETFGALDDAVRRADAVLIAGGGNMNSRFAYHLYERVSLKRLAERHDKPLFVTSQTVGPELLPRDEELLKELVDYATCFGSREASSQDLVLRLGGRAGAAVHTLDDAILLEARDEDRAALARLSLPPRYVVAGLTSHQGTTSMTDEGYVAALATTLDALAVDLDADVLVAPHVGSFQEAEPVSDQLLATALQEASTTGRLRPLPLLTARQHIALTAQALLTVSTRYHPSVFGAAVQVPAVCIATSYYSSVRMRGSMANVGLEGYVIPAAAWQAALPAMAELARRDDYAAHMQAVMPGLIELQQAWWDAIVQAMHTGRWEGAASLGPVPQLEPQGAWSTEARQVFPVFDELGVERIRTLFADQEREERKTVLDRVRKDLAAARRDLKAARRSLSVAEADAQAQRARLAALRRRKAVRLADGLARLTRRLRRPGR